MSAATSIRLDERGITRELAKIQVRRYVRHPLYLVGVVMLGFGLVRAWARPDAPGSHWDELGLSSGIFIGILGLVVANRLTVSEDEAVALLPSAPSDQHVRTLALCATCLVPAGTVAAFMGLYAVVNHVSPGAAEAAYSLRPADGTIGWVDYVATNAEVVVAGAGGALLGVVTGRWLRFPGAGALVAVGLFVLELVALGIGEGGPSWWEAWYAQAFTDLMPWVYWGAAPGDGGTYLQMRPGSPAGHLVYAVALCALAVTAAVLHGASRAQRHRWMRRGRVILAVAAAGYLWAVVG